MLTGTIDRIVDNEMAVILIENTEDREQLVIDKEQIPEDMQYGNCMIRFEKVDDENIKNIEHLEERESKRKKRLQDKFDRLSTNLSDSEE